ncbi:hypothetical protein BDV06DRAFT_192096 [Aspergillus oleicola]
MRSDRKAVIADTASQPLFLQARGSNSTAIDCVCMQYSLFGALFASILRTIFYLSWYSNDIL